MSDWGIGLHYDPQMGYVAIQPTCPHGATRQPWLIPLAAMLRRFGLGPDQLRAVLADAADPSTSPSPVADFDALCAAAIPADLAGKTVLDVGGYDGRFARLCLDRGAARAVCLDSHQWTRYGWSAPPPLPGVEYAVGDLLDWTEPVDVVLFFNVAYHLKNPWAGFERLRAITREHLALCSLTDWSDRPVWTVRKPFEVNPQDDTVYWTPSEPGLVALLENVGFVDVARVGKAVERVVLTARPGGGS